MAAYPSFEALIEQIMSPDNTARSNAERYFEELQKQPDALVSEMLNILTNPSANASCRPECAILLRRVLVKKEPPIWDSVSPGIQGTTKEKLLDLFSKEQSPSLHRKISDLVSELGIYIVFKNPDGWPELLPFMFNCVQSQDPRLMEGSLNMFAQIAPYLQPVLVQHLQTMFGILQACMGEGLSLDVRGAALSAAGVFMEELESEQHREQFFQLVPAMMDVMKVAVQNGEEKNAQEALETFIEIAEIHPKFVRGALSQVLETMMTVAEAAQLEESTRKLAAEFVVTLCEAREQAPGMMRKLPQLNHRLFMCLMGYLLDVEDDPEWYTTEDEEGNHGEGELCEFGQECLDRVAIALGGPAILHTAQGAAVVAGFLTNYPQDWRYRHAALICLAQIAEGCAKVMLKEIGSLVGMCMQGLQDPHPRVRWAACQAIGQMCTDLGPDIQEQEHVRILPALMAAMKDPSSPRVQGHASAAVVNFTDNCDRDLIAQYLDPLISSLINQLQTGTKAVKESSLPALSSLADCAQEYFVKYYDQVMPLLFTIMMHAKERSMLRAKCLECVSLVGMAVGRDRSREDAKKIMAMITQWQQDSDDPTFAYTLQAGARLCKCLGEEFLPYMDAVMPPLINAANEENYFEVTNEDDDEEEEDDDVATFQVGDKSLNIRISALEEKATACNMLRCYADELKEGFFRWVEGTAKIMVPLLKFFCWEDVRMAAANSLEPLLRSAKLAVEKQVPGASADFCQQMLSYLWTNLMAAIQKEHEPTVIDCMVDAIREIVDLLPEMITDEQKQEAFKAMEQVMMSCSERRMERMKRKESEDFDEQEAEALKEENELEEELIQQVANALGVMLKHYKDKVMPLVEGLLPRFYPMLDKTKATAEERRIAIGLMDDMLEHAPASSAKYLQQMVPTFIDAMTEPDAPDLNQCAVYGVGVVAKNFTAELAPALTQVLERTVGMIQAPGARSKDNEPRFDNAVSTLGKLIAAYGEQLGEQGKQLMELWVGSLPITADTEEAKEVHQQLAQWVANKDPRVLGDGNKNLQKILEVYVKVLGSGTELCEAPVGLEIARQMQEIASALPPELPQALAAQLKADEQANLQSYMAGQPPAST